MLGLCSSRLALKLMIKALYLFSSKSISVFLLILVKFLLKSLQNLLTKIKTEIGTRLQRHFKTMANILARINQSDFNLKKISISFNSGNEDFFRHRDHSLIVDACKCFNYQYYGQNLTCKYYKFFDQTKF